MRAFSFFALGVLFALGLAISGMTQPLKVLGFLDVFGQWDPTLMFVMTGAVAVSFLGYRLVRGWSRPLLATAFDIPTGVTSTCDSSPAQRSSASVGDSRASALDRRSSRSPVSHAM